jgi:glycosyltransferase involved in cell wall biosynthesis
MLGTWYHEALVAEASRSLEKLKLPKEQFHILFNDDRDRDLFEKFGFSGAIVNHNSFLDETRFFCNEQSKKSFDCIYVGRLANFKRHNLCSELDTLALVCGELNGAESSNYIPPHTYKNSQALTEVEVCEKINESNCGLILSATEGACFASSEYLLCGIPVISTASEGGRAIWYDEYNSLIVEANPLAVKDAVQFFVKNPRNPNVIRNAHIALSRVHRSNFIKLFSQVLECCGQDVRDPVRYFAESFFHKMRGYIKPEFSVLFRY